MKKENKQMEEHTRNAYYRGMNAGILIGLAVGLGSWGLNVLTVYMMTL